VNTAFQSAKRRRNELYSIFRIYRNTWQGFPMYRCLVFQYATAPLQPHSIIRLQAATSRANGSLSPLDITSPPLAVGALYCNYVSLCAELRHHCTPAITSSIAMFSCNSPLSTAISSWLCLPSPTSLSKTRWDGMSERIKSSLKCTYDY
jgi:hypothetical protein